MAGAIEFASTIGAAIGGVAGGFAFFWAWARRVAAKGIDSQSLRELRVVEKKNDEAHRQFDERLRALELETSRQKGVLEQINERLGEILGLLRNTNTNARRN